MTRIDLPQTEYIKRKPSNGYEVTGTGNLSRTARIITGMRLTEQAINDVMFRTDRAIAQKEERRAKRK